MGTVFAETAYGYALSVILSEKFQTDVINIDIHDDDVFCYWYFCNGEEIDSFNSCPDYFGEAEMTMPDIDNDKMRELMQEATKKIKENYDFFSSCKTQDDLMNLMTKIKGDLMLKLMQEIGKIGKNSKEKLSISPPTGESETNESTGNPTCFFDLLKSEGIEKLTALLESMRNNSSIFISVDAQHFCDLFGLSDGINSYEYLLDDGMPEGYVQVFDEKTQVM
ncbi:hypothetical protein FACS189443_2810 [Planctomycetales bacterium]|nr:hypothetical protein FACS189443_2810 [Planctomycetales bacterium]